ncbi:MAG: hypothetical protein FJZ12_03500, partial [Candidatus Omnitrophica bacterium]|nr:hypothetical protein [Candidatus Omnitrophota bacterium]
MPGGLTSEDKIIVLASCATTAGLISGAVSGGIGGWITKHKLSVSLSGVLAGAFLGWLAGSIVGNILFPSVDGNVMIAKWGLDSLLLTLKGNIITSIVTAILISIPLTFITKSDFKEAAGPCIGASIVTG